VRIPAALCGVVGFKPHHWHISKLGVIPLSETLDHVGVLARTPGDVELAYTVSDGNARGKFGFPVSTKRTKRTRWNVETQGVKRVGIARDGFTSMVAPSVQTCIDAVEKWVIAQGLECGFVDLSFIEETWKATRIVLAVEAAAYHLERMRSNPQGFGDDVRPRLEEGMGYSGVEYVRAVRTGDTAEERLRAIFHKYDVLLLPTLPMTAPRHDDAQGIANARLRFSGFNAPFNLASCYAMSVPVGLDEDGLPIGIQILANTPYLGYLGFFAFAQRLQQGVGWDGRLPEL
jgi:aspartyl-tRNA(Asn)/glutamyl-tRNA(Gln) amidotransferase subunit A